MLVDVEVSQVQLMFSRMVFEGEPVQVREYPEMLVRDNISRHQQYITPGQLITNMSAKGTIITK